MRFLAIVLSVLGAVVAALASLNAVAAADRPRNLTVVEHAVSDTVVDTGAAGDSLGDVLAFGNPIYNAANSTQTGRDQGYCMRTNVGMAWECNWTVLLNHGSLVVEGPFYDSGQDSELAITGGTGAFLGARGSMTLHARNAAGTEYDFIYHLSH